MTQIRRTRHSTFRARRCTDRCPPLPGTGRLKLRQTVREKRHARSGIAAGESRTKRSCRILRRRTARADRKAMRAIQRPWSYRYSKMLFQLPRPWGARNGHPQHRLAGFPRIFRKQIA